MNLKTLSDHELDSAAIIAAKNERAALLEVLRHLLEVDRRKSFSPRFESIHAYAVGFLGYDPKSAWRRVSAMRLATGKLDLTKMALAQNHFRNEMKASHQPITDATISFFQPDVLKAPLTKDEKLEILDIVANQTSRVAERDLISRSSNPANLKRPDQVKPLAHDKNEVRVCLTDEDLALIQELKILLAHKIPNASIGEILNAALKAAVTSVKKEKTGENQKRRAACERSASGEKCGDVKTARAENMRRPSRALKVEIWKRANGKCEICESTYALEIDHRVPWAKGGKTNLENGRLLCRVCNQRESIKHFGPHTVRDRQLEYCA